MTKIDRIMKLIILLSHRRYVSLETIMSTCDIPRRTAFRYLNTISEANIPVYFDREKRMYTLNRNRSWLTAGFELGDVLLVTLALRMLKRHVNDAYREDIDQLIADLLVRQPCQVDDVMDTFEGSIRESGGAGDCSDLITSMLLHAAILCERKVRLTTGNGPRGGQDVDIEKPRLLFRRQWQVVDAADDREGTRTPLADVQKVSIG